MSISEKIRKRRQRRIKQLQARRLTDPEVAWKYRDNPWESLPMSPQADHPVHEEFQPHHRVGWNEIRGKLLVSVILFALAWGLFQLDDPWATQGQQFIVTSLTENSDFQSVQVWYEHWFEGAPSFIPSFRASPSAEVHQKGLRQVFVPVKKAQVVQPFTLERKGIMLETSAQSVHAYDEGQVKAVTEMGNGQVIMMIQHPGQLQTVYGHLDQSNYQRGDWVKGGEIIGEVSVRSGKGQLFFAMNKDRKYMNPLDVISFDE